jgi:hypothetical protein
MGMTDKVTKPSHYQFEKPCAEVRDVIRDRIKRMLEAGYDPELVYDYSNAIKYTLRWPMKNGVEDVAKALETMKEVYSLLINEKGKSCPTKVAYMKGQFDKIPTMTPERLKDYTERLLQDEFQRV